MKKITKGDIPLKEILGPQASAFPVGYRFPWQVYVRQTAVDYPRSDVEATWAGVGVVTLRKDGEFDFQFQPDYAESKSYEPTMKGVWR